MELLWILVLIGVNFHRFCYAYNIDVIHARIWRGPESSMFGFTSVFHQTKTGIQLIVGAPKAVRKGIRSGATFNCDVTRSNNSCQMDYMEFQNDDSPDNEMYGAFITKAERNNTLVCAPRFRSEWQMIGRCAARESGTDIIPVYPEKEQDDMGYVRNVSAHRQIYWNALGQWGMAGDTLQDGSVVLGRPGFMNWRGGVVRIKDLLDFIEIPTDNSILEDSYIGYAVAAGNFCGSQNLCFAAGGPRRDKVLIYRYRKGKAEFKVRQTITSEQMWSYFGASLCAADVNSDGLDDLFVGAPYYSDLNKGDNRDKHIFRDEGRVTVYITTKNPSNRKRMRLIKSITLAGSNKHDARFGTAISNIGDVNGDGYTDVAIGAPFESDRQGAVYIYHGGAAGLQSAVQQKIMGRDVSETMTSFGWSISKSLDIDNNHYPDVAIGAYKSDAVVILRTRPIVNLQVTIETDPNPISHGRHFCSEGSGSEDCFKIKLCFRYKGQRLPKTLEFNFTLTLDTSKQQDKKRALLNSTQGNTDTVSAGIRLTSRQRHCEEFIAETRKNQMNADPFSIVRLEAKYDLISTPDPKSDLRPVLNQTDPRKAVLDTAFQLDCGSDDKCESDLVLELKSRAIHDNYDVIRPELNSTMIVNVTKSVVIEAKVKNKKDHAFGTVVHVSWTGSVTFLMSETSPDQLIACDIESGEISQLASQTDCRVMFPIDPRTPFHFNIHFRCDDVDLEDVSSSVDVSVSLTTVSTEINPDDNAANASVPIVIDAHTIIRGLADPDQTHVQIDRPSRPSIYITHKYVVKNKGPSFLPSTDVLVELPYMTNASSPLTKSLHVTISFEDGTLMSCESRDGHSSGSGQSISPTMQTSASPSVDNETKLPSPSKLVNHDSTKNIEHNLDCTTYRCKEFLCTLQQLPSGGSAVITTAIALPVTQLPSVKETIKLNYFSRATVIPPTHPSVYPWNGTVSYQLMTRIYPHKDPVLNLFIIIGSVVCGVILFIIIIIGLWKCGFFKREKKDKVQEWRDNQMVSNNRPMSNAFEKPSAQG